MSSTTTPDSSNDSGSGSGPSRGGPPRRSKFGRFGARRREVEPEEPLEYKNIGYLSKFVSPNGRILSRKRTGFSGQNQRKLAAAIKNARMIGLMPFVGRV
ncbi:MAG: 30S ribosomal protein S18 [Planctomycetes bacterium]|nr:30S ribosomal protein S18 [Planctomycetota bacterium]